MPTNMSTKRLTVVVTTITTITTIITKKAD